MIAPEKNIPKSRLSFTLSAAALVVSNLVPLAGVLFLGWHVLDILLLFWLENIVIGLINVLKMFCVAISHKENGNLALLPFFIVHYGIFAAVHGIFVCALFAPPGSGAMAAPLGFAVNYVLHAPGMWVATASLFGSHLVSFLAHFIIGGEIRRTTLPNLMRQPYRRVILLHLTILAGGGLVEVTGAKKLGVAALVLIKTALDLTAHRKTHKPLAQSSAGL